MLLAAQNAPRASRPIWVEVPAQIACPDEGALWTALRARLGDEHVRLGRAEGQDPSLRLVVRGPRAVTMMLRRGGSTIVERDVKVAEGECAALAHTLALIAESWLTAPPRRPRAKSHAATPEQPRPIPASHEETASAPPPTTAPAARAAGTPSPAPTHAVSPSAMPTSAAPPSVAVPALPAAAMPAPLPAAASAATMPAAATAATVPAAASAATVPAAASAATVPAAASAATVPAAASAATMPAAATAPAPAIVPAAMPAARAPASAEVAASTSREPAQAKAQPTAGLQNRTWSVTLAASAGAMVPVGGTTSWTTTGRLALQLGYRRWFGGVRGAVESTTDLHPAVGNVVAGASGSTALPANGTMVVRYIPVGAYAGRVLAESNRFTFAALAGGGGNILSARASGYSSDSSHTAIDPMAFAGLSGEWRFSRRFAVLATSDVALDFHRYQFWVSNVGPVARTPRARAGFTLGVAWHLR